MDRCAYHLRLAIEKDASFASAAGNVWKGLKTFARKPFSTTMKKMFTRAPSDRILKNVGSEIGYGVKWGGGLAAGGIAASPFFVKRPI